MSESLAGKRALVTGAGQGIGRATALAFANEGAHVIATSRTASKMAGMEGERIQCLPLDVTDSERVAALIAEYQPIDILFNCAGWVHDGTILDCDPQAWQKSLDQNVTSVYSTTRATLPGMLERGCGVIINVASVASSVTGVANRAGYGAAKAAVIGLTKAVARDFCRQGIRCIALCPGTTDSPSLHSRIDATADPEATRAAFRDRQPMGRLGRPEELAAAAVYLAGDGAGFITGSTFVVDGGQTM